MKAQSSFALDAKMVTIASGASVPLVSIVDQNQGKSVTNDIENVLLDVADWLPIPLEDCALMYRDSMGNWDEILIEPATRNFRAFKALPRGRCHTELEAIVCRRAWDRIVEKKPALRSVS